MSDLMDKLWGITKPKPKFYRTALGHFRKETKREFRARHDDTAWAHLKIHSRQCKQIAKHIISHNPWAELLGIK